MKKLYVLLVLMLFIPMMAQSQVKVKLGIDVLSDSNFKQINGKRIALLSNFAGRSNTGELTADILINHTLSHQSDSIETFDFKAILAPEHGFFTTIPAGKKVGDATYKGFPIYSLYGDTRKPTSKIMNDIDIILIDMQDIGVRSYTYLSTVYKTMVAASFYGKKVVLLDRPNPIGGLVVDGGTVEEGHESFVSIIPISYIHGCTFGELATMINKEGWLKNDSNEVIQCDLEVIKMDGWQRWMSWEDTGLYWYPTSPHVPSVAAVRGLASFGIFGELSIFSIGIGTTMPFQIIGKPDFDFDKINTALLDYEFSSFAYSQMNYMPFYGMYSNKAVNGYFFNFYNYTNCQPFTDGIRFVLALRRVYPEVLNKELHKERSVKMFRKVTGTKKLYYSLVNYIDDATVFTNANINKEIYLEIRDKYLMYF